jgi:hypothetical protein
MRTRRMAALASLAAAVALGSVALNPAVGAAEAANGTPRNVATDEKAVVNAAAVTEDTTEIEQPSNVTFANGVRPNATWQCNWWVNPANQFNANCDVTSGYLRLYAQCQDGSWIYSPLVGQGSWYLWVRCGSGLYQYGFQTAD